MANIFLNELDKFIEDRKAEFDIGKTRTKNPHYTRLSAQLCRKRKLLRHYEQCEGRSEERVLDLEKQINELGNKLKQIPTIDTYEEGFKRLRYVRYADDFACGIIGSKADAEAIFSSVKDFLKQKLNLEVEAKKSAICNMKDGFKYLGYHVSINPNNPRQRKRLSRHINERGNRIYQTQRTLTHKIFLQVPMESVWEFCSRNKFLKNGKPVHKVYLQNSSDYEIVSQINAEMRGFANYFALAPKSNLYIMQWAGITSLFKTLAAKHKTSTQKIRSSMKRGDDHFIRYKSGDQFKYLKVFKLKDRHKVDISKLDIIPNTSMYRGTTEIIERMMAERCEYCGVTKGPFEVHHVRKLKDIANRASKAPWELCMQERRRKTLVLCKNCHSSLHKGDLQSWKRDYYTKMESAVR